MKQLSSMAFEDEGSLDLILVESKKIIMPDLLLTWPKDTKVLGLHPTFAWHGVNRTLSYQFVLSNVQSLKIVNTSVVETRIGKRTDIVKWPTDITLDGGTDYTWEVVAHLITGVEYRAHAYFSTLEDSVRKQVEIARPAPGASFSERAVYARILERLDLRQEATKIWRELALLRPNHVSLQIRVR